MAKTKSAERETNTGELEGESSETHIPTPPEPDMEAHAAMPATEVGGADASVRVAEQAHGGTSPKGKKPAPGTANPNKSVASVMRFRRRIRTPR